MIRRILASQQAGLVLVIVLLGLVLSAFTGTHLDRATGQPVNDFLNSYTLIQTATDASFFAVMAVGATMVIISGGIDLSVGSVYALAGVAMAMVLRAVEPSGTAATVALGLAVSLSVGLACGAINGLMVVGLRVHPFIITLGTMWILRGIAFVVSGAESILLPAPLTRVAKASLGLAQSLYPVPMIVMLAVTACGAVYLSQTVMGRHIFAFGGNPEASRFSGLRLQRVQASVFVIAGPDGRNRGVHGREFLRVRVLRRRHRLRAVRHRVGRRRRREPVGRQGERRERDARGAADRADPSVDPHAALRPELRMDHHRLRDHRRGGPGPGEREVCGAEAGAVGGPELARNKRVHCDSFGDQFVRYGERRTHDHDHALAPDDRDGAFADASALTACGGGESSTPSTGAAPAGQRGLKIAMIAKSSTNPVFLSARTGAEAAAKELSQKTQRAD